MLSFMIIYLITILSLSTQTYPTPSALSTTTALSVAMTFISTAPPKKSSHNSKISIPNSLFPNPKPLVIFPPMKSTLLQPAKMAPLSASPSLNGAGFGRKALPPTKTSTFSQASASAVASLLAPVSASLANSNLQSIFATITTMD
jgi:hypothetical protein